MSPSSRTVAILCGGGPAPGMNGVINAVTLAAKAYGWKVLGVPWGFQSLMDGDTKGVRELTSLEVEREGTRGGVMLGTSRANPRKDPAHLENVAKTLEKLGVTDLVTIGGDDTASSALAVSESAGGRFRVVHVPKTIDNDLPLPADTPTFGYETAKHLGAQLVRNLAVDAQSTGRWYLLTVMGRNAGHLAVGMGTSGGAHITIIPEEFPSGTIKLDDLATVVEGGILQHLTEGRPDGTVVLAEGLIDRMDPAEVAEVTHVEVDEHGHPRLSEISLGSLVRDVLKERFQSRGVPVKHMIAKELGYELRCQDPVGSDVQYTRTLGVGAVDFLHDDKTGAVITVVDGRTTPIPFEDLKDKTTGRVEPRLVDPKGAAWRTCLGLQSRITSDDLSDEARLAQLADASREVPDELRERFRHLTRT